MITQLPDVTFETRVRDENFDGPGSFRWQDRTSAEIFAARIRGYSMFVDDGEVKKVFVEPGRADNVSDDPYETFSPDTMRAWLRSRD